MSGYHQSIIPPILGQLALLIHATVEGALPAGAESEEPEVIGSRLLSQAIHRILGLEEGANTIELKHVHPWRGTDDILNVFATQAGTSNNHTAIACTVSSSNPAVLATLNFELGAIRAQQLLRAGKTSNTKGSRIRIGPVGYVHFAGVADGLTTRRLVNDNRKRQRTEVTTSTPSDEEFCAVLIEGFLASQPINAASYREAQRNRIMTELIPKTLNETLPALALELKTLYGATLTVLHPRDSREEFLRSDAPFLAAQDNDPVPSYAFCDFGAQMPLATTIVTSDQALKHEQVCAFGRLLVAFSPHHPRATSCATHFKNLLAAAKSFNGNPIRVNVISASQFIKSVRATGVLEGGGEY